MLMVMVNQKAQKLKQRQQEGGGEEEEEEGTDTLKQKHPLIAQM